MISAESKKVIISPAHILATAQLNIIVANDISDPGFFVIMI
jgi:hypothetical protein